MIGKSTQIGMNTRQQGFNLVEVLVAMVILSIGLLGIAGMQVTGVRSNQGSYSRSQATAIMNDLAERMHNNLPGVAAGNYTGLDSSGGCGPAPTACGQENGGSAPARCTAQQMAAYDFYTVTCGLPTGVAGVRAGRIDQMLAGGRAQVECINNAAPPVAVAAANCLVGFRHRITVSWTDRTQADASTPNEQTMQTQSVITVLQP